MMESRDANLGINKCVIRCQNERDCSQTSETCKIIGYCMTRKVSILQTEATKIS